MEFIPGPFQILERVRNAPDRWSRRIGALRSKVAPLVDDAVFYARTAFPGLRKAGLRKGSAMGTGRFLGKALPITSQLFGAYEGTNRLLRGEPAHKVALGYGYALPGPWGWANMAADLAVPGGESSSQSQISNIGVTPKEFQVGGKYEPSEEALIDLADQATLVNNQGEYIGGVLPEGDGIDHSATWLHKTRNSPAQRSGAWNTPEGKDQLWQQHLMNQDFQQAKKSGTLDDFAAKYPHSQTAKERAIRNKIPTSMDMEF